LSRAALCIAQMRGPLGVPHGEAGVESPKERHVLQTPTGSELEGANPFEEADGVQPNSADEEFANALIAFREWLSDLYGRVVKLVWDNLEG
jgi:hypothetical protein